MSGILFLIILLALFISLFVYGVMLFNNLVALRNNIKRNWANIDILLKQRHDELPKLIESCKHYMKHEKETLSNVVEARSAVMSAKDKGSMPALGQAETKLRMGLGALFALSENYPDLKANQSFMQLQTRITGLENAIADRREFYNESVNINNTRIEQFPDRLISHKFNFKQFELLEFSAHDIQDIDIKKAFT